MLGAKGLLIAMVGLLGCNAQQICLKQECAPQMTACDQNCRNLMTNCTFECTLLSQGCMQDCTVTNAKASDLLTCSYEKCLNY